MTIVRSRAGFARFREHIGRFRLTSYESEETVEKRPPSPDMSLPISLELYQQLLCAATRAQFKKEAWEIGAAAIRDWLVRNDPESFTMPTTSGYQWKHLFLPNGTLLRTIYNGKNFHCLVEDDDILFNGKKVSPSGFANAVGGMRRNAWNVVWILFPGNPVWKLAGTLRRRATTDRSNSPKAQR